jgi:hypothetical protein
MSAIRRLLVCWTSQSTVDVPLFGPSTSASMQVLSSQTTDSTAADLQDRVDTRKGCR